MTPKTAQVKYAIKFEVWDSDASKGSRAKKIQEALHPVYVLPTRPELAQLLILQSQYYRLQAERSISGGVLRSTLGSLVASTAQPPAIQLDGPQPQDASTTLRINLRFEPTQ